MPRKPHYIQARRYGMRPSRRNFRKSRGWKLPPGTRYSIHGLWYGPEFVIRNPRMKPLLHRGKKL